MFSRHLVRTSLKAARRPMAVRAGSTFAKYNWQDPLNLEKLLTDEEKMVR